MPQFFLSDLNPTTGVIDLGNSPALTVTNHSATAVKVHVDCLQNGNWVSAIRADAGYHNPFTLQPAATRIVAKGDLESEHVRVGVDGNAFNVTGIY